MLSMLAWTLMTAMVVMNAHGQFCPTMTDSRPGENKCLHDNYLCGKEDDSGSCTSLCHCKSGQMCFRDNDHTITAVPRIINDRPVEITYYTCVALSSLNECSGIQEALKVLSPEAEEGESSVEVLCRCPSPKKYRFVFIRPDINGDNPRYVCANAPRRHG
nr:TPA_inf: conotoxin precursor Tpra06 [Conus judaeus]